MSEDINGALARLAVQPVPTALAQTEARVLVRIAAFGPRLRDLPVSFWLGAATSALVLGILGGLVSTTSEELPLFPLAPESRLAPSTLLAE